MCRKLGAVPLWGELGPHLTQCGLGRGLPLYQVTSWSIQPFGHSRHGPKIGEVEGLCPFGEGSWVPIWHNVARAEAYLRDKFHLDPSNPLATVHQRYRQRDRQTDRQRSDSIGRTVLQTVAQKSTDFNTVSSVIFNKWSAVAEMGDRLTTIDMGRKVMGEPFYGGAGFPI